MITVADLDRVLAMMQQHGLQTLRVQEGETLLALTLSGGSSAIAISRKEVTVQTKAIGRLLLRHPQQPNPAVLAGDAVGAQTIIAYLENGPVLLPVIAGKAGELLRFEASEGSLLGYGAPVATLLSEA